MGAPALAGRGTARHRNAWGKSPSRAPTAADALPSSAACVNAADSAKQEPDMIRKLASGEYRIYSRQPDPKTGKRRNLGTFPTRAKAEKHEREIQYFKHH